MRMQNLCISTCLYIELYDNDPDGSKQGAALLKQLTITTSVYFVGLLQQQKHDSA